MTNKRYKNLYANKAIKTIIIINLFLIIIIMCYFIYFYNNLDNKKNFLNHNLEILLGIIIFTVIINSYIAIKDVFSLNKIRNENNYKNIILTETEDLNRKLRAQRHDFLNHLQVVYSLIEMDEYKEVREYIEKTYDDIQKINSVIKTSLVPINALLQAKVSHCENKNIDIKVNISSSLDNLCIPAWEMCRVLGNIIDNAIYAVLDKRKKYIEISIKDRLDIYIFEIKNTGDKITDDISNKIFEAGFTTKDDYGSGMGLYITKDIVENYSGNISFTSDNNITSFKIEIPKMNNQ